MRDGAGGRYPGTLARLLAEIGELGANIEDLRLNTRRVLRWYG